MADKDFIKDVVYSQSIQLLATGSANIRPVQVKYESENITETINENRSSNSDFQYRTKTKDEKGNQTI